MAAPTSTEFKGFVLTKDGFQIENTDWISVEFKDFGVIELAKLYEGSAMAQSRDKNVFYCPRSRELTVSVPGRTAAGDKWVVACTITDLQRIQLRAAIGEHLTARATKL